MCKASETRRCVSYADDDDDDDNKSITNTDQHTAEKKKTKSSMSMIHFKYIVLKYLWANFQYYYVYIHSSRTLSIQTWRWILCEHTHERQQRWRRKIKQQQRRIWVLGVFFFHVYCKSLNWFDRQNLWKKKRINSIVLIRTCTATDQKTYFVVVVFRVREAPAHLSLFETKNCS